MKLITQNPSVGLRGLFSDWLRPDSLFDRELFDLSSDLFPTRLGINVPPVNVKETPKEYELDVAVPGMERKDFKIEVENHSLTISAEKEEKEEKKEEGYSKKEYSYASFSRCFNLPENIKENNIEAKYENGILKIHVPKAKETPAKAAHQIAVS